MVGTRNLPQTAFFEGQVVPRANDGEASPSEERLRPQQRRIAGAAFCHIIILACWLFGYIAWPVFWPGAAQDSGGTQSIPKSTVSAHVKTVPTAAKPFICNDKGQVLPIILTGVRKSGSTTFWRDFLPVLWQMSPKEAERRGIVCERANFTECKEIGNFGMPERNFDLGLFWGNCSDPQPGVVMDFSTETFHPPQAPQKVKEQYGRKYQEVIFVWGLREPVNRAVSDFYQYQRFRVTHGMRIWNTFPEYAAKALNMWWRDFGGSCERQICMKSESSRPLNLLTPGLYYQNIRNWLDSGFLASQIIIYPVGMYFSHRKPIRINPVVQALRSRIGLNTINLTRAWRRGKIANKRPKKVALPENAMDNATLLALVKTRLEKEVFAAENKKLFQLLAEQVDEGMTLIGYTGEANDTEAVEEWMTSNWNY